MPNVTRPRPAPDTGLRGLLALPFRGRTWRHLLYALLVPLVAGLVLILQFVMKAASDSGHPGVGPLVLLAALVAAAVAGPSFERMRLRVFFGERVAPRSHARFTGGAAFFFLNMLLMTLSCAATVGWVIVCAQPDVPDLGVEALPRRRLGRADAGRRGRPALLLRCAGVLPAAVGGPAGHRVAARGGAPLHRGPGLTGRVTAAAHSGGRAPAEVTSAGARPRGAGLAP